MGGFVMWLRYISPTRRLIIFSRVFFAGGGGGPEVLFLHC